MSQPAQKKINLKFGQLSSQQVSDMASCTLGRPPARSAGNKPSPLKGGLSNVFNQAANGLRRQRPPRLGFSP